MNNNETIEDKEILYRRVKVHKPNIHFNDRRYERHKSGKIEVLPLAFYDVNREYLLIELLNIISTHQKLKEIKQTVLQNLLLQKCVI